MRHSVGSSPSGSTMNNKISIEQLSYDCGKADGIKGFPPAMGSKKYLEGYFAGRKILLRTLRRPKIEELLK